MKSTLMQAASGDGRRRVADATCATRTWRSSPIPASSSSSRGDPGPTRRYPPGRDSGVEPTGCGQSACGSNILVSAASWAHNSRAMHFCRPTKPQLEKRALRQSCREVNRQPKRRRREPLDLTLGAFARRLGEGRVAVEVPGPNGGSHRSRFTNNSLVDFHGDTLHSRSGHLGRSHWRRTSRG